MCMNGGQCVGQQCQCAPGYVGLNCGQGIYIITEFIQNLNQIDILPLVLIFIIFII